MYHRSPTTAWTRPFLVNKDHNYWLKLAKICLSVLIRQPPSNWLLQSAHSSKYMLIEVDDDEILDASTSALLDFTAIQSLSQHTASSGSSMEILEAFLTQFHNLPVLLGGYYENMTSDLISAAARLQSQLLRKSDTVVSDTTPHFPTDLSSDDTVIALALHCLATIHFLDVIDLHNPNIPEAELFLNGSPVLIMEQEDDERRFLPTVRLHQPEYHPVPGLGSAISNQSTEESGSGLRLDREFHRMLEHVVHVSFRLLDAQDPRHWPTVLYVLVILSVGVRDSLHPFLRWKRRLRDAQEGFDLVFQDLARYYCICTDGGQILSGRWNREEYAARVQQDMVAVEHAEILNRLWLEIGMLHLLIYTVLF